MISMDDIVAFSECQNPALSFEKAVEIAREVRKPPEEQNLSADDLMRVNEAHMILASEYLAEGKVAPA